jgi:hypothetical protein
VDRAVTDDEWPLLDAELLEPGAPALEAILGCVGVWLLLLRQLVQIAIVGGFVTVIRAPY